MKKVIVKLFLVLLVSALTLAITGCTYADQIKDYLENGNIKNSVNFPAVSMARSADTRICVLHRNKPNVIATVTGAIAATGANVDNMESKSRGDYGYMIIDVTGPAAEAAKATENLVDVIRVRVIK